MGLELWTAGVGIPGFGVRQATRAEQEGWDGIGFVDSQNLAGDPFVELALAAAATSTIKVATAVTNPLTRHPAAMAAAAATIHAESGGRFVLGIGRGDSSLAHLGLAPAPVNTFRHFLERLQGYLRGDDVAFEAVEGVHTVDALGMAAGPSASRLRWLPKDLPKVAVDVAATGPKVIAAGAQLGDRVTLAVGADAGRVTWGIEQVRAANPDVPVGMYVPLVVHPDRDEARKLVAGGVASYARFSVMHGNVVGPASADQARTLTAVHDAYDMEHHFSFGSPQSKPLTDEVIDAFGIAGPASYCVERLQELAELGVEKVFVLGGGFGLDRDRARETRTRLVEDVLPALR